MRFVALILLAFAMAAPAWAQPAEPFQLGKHYYAIDPPQPTSSGNKIEVLEIFMYTCPHCYDLEPYLVKWKATAPAPVFCFFPNPRMPMVNLLWYVNVHHPARGSFPRR